MGLGVCICAREGVIGFCSGGFRTSDSGCAYSAGRVRWDKRVFVSMAQL